MPDAQDGHSVAVNAFRDIDMKTYSYVYDGEPIFPPVEPTDTFAFPPSSIMAAHNHLWIDTEYATIPEDIVWDIYPQPSRPQIPIGQGSYLLRLPPGYDQDTYKRYPVLFWLHGGLQTQRETVWALQYYGRKMEEGKMPACIIVAPQVLPIGRYIDNYDGTRPLARVVANDLVAAVESRYRTIRHRTARWLEGFSMGGYGTLHLGFSHPEVFGALSAIAPACLPRLSDEMPRVVADTFGGNPEFYNVTHPYHLVGANIDRIRGRQAVRVLTGELDTRLTLAIDRLLKRFDQVGLEYEHRETTGAAHVYPHLLAGAGDWVTGWWSSVAKNVQRAPFDQT